jgi:hypothetical protein
MSTNKLGRTLALVSILLLLGSGGCSSRAVIGDSVAEQSLSSTTPAAPLDYAGYASLLKKYVSADGLVDYKGLKANREPLDQFNRALGNVSSVTYQAWSEKDKLAFLINAYNSLTLASIIDHYPIKSIRDIPGVWKGRKFSIVGQEVTLDDIEHNTIRKQFQEPRIHFAVNCASIGCPTLLNEPYTGDKLNQQLDRQTRVSLANPLHFRINRDENRVYLSSVFKWFGEDWEKTQASSLPIQGLNRRETAFANFISRFVSPADQTFLKQGGYRIGYIDWDWALNRQSSQTAGSY